MQQVISDDDAGRDLKAPTGWSPISVLRKLRTSTTVHEVLDEAGRLLIDNGYGLGIDTSVLLRAILSVGERSWQGKSQGAEKNATAFLFNVMKAQISRNPTTALNEYFSSQSERRRINPRRELRVTANVVAVFDQASSFASDTRGRESTIAARHLVAALLDIREPASDKVIGAQITLREIGVDADVVRHEFFESLCRAPQLTPTEREVWTRIAQQKQRIRLIPAFNADEVSGADCLGFESDAAAMAALVSSRSLRPPLSIGVFGNWGSGKSFFLQRTRYRIEQHAKQSGQGGYWPNIATIEFNAWHYADSNLWASLVSHLFEELARWENQQFGNKPPHDSLGAAIAALEISKLAKAEAIKRAEEAEAALGVAKQAVATLEKSHEVASEERAKQILTSTLGLAWESLKSDSTIDRAVKSLEQLEGDAGDAQAMLRVLMARSQHLVTASGRFFWILRDCINRIKTWSLLLFVIVPALAIVSGGVLLNVPSGIQYATTIAVQCATMAALAHSVIRKSLKSLQPVFSALDSARSKIDEVVERYELEKQQKVLKLSEKLVLLEKELIDAKEACTKAAREVAVAQAALRDIQTGREIGRFIAMRAASSDYKKHLGLVATIRADLRRLSDLVDQHNRRMEQGEPGDNLGLNRIVLLVDDLDRCAEERVLEVLQAIHLLLAFPIFVVVVAVDYRWVSTSLHGAYPKQILSPDSNAKASRLGPTSSDYLEKIFQIPYQVRCEEDNAFSGLIDHLTFHDELDDISPDVPKRADPAEPEPTTTAAASGISATPVIGYSTTTGVLALTAPEVQALREIAVAVGRTPRAVKRVVNIYRILKAAIPHKDAPVFLHGDFRCAMLPLAVALCLPTQRERIFGDLRSRSGKFVEHDLQRQSEASEGPRLSRDTEILFSRLPGHWSEIRFSSFAKWIPRASQFTFPVSSVTLDWPASKPAWSESE